MLERSLLKVKQTEQRLLNKWSFLKRCITVQPHGCQSVLNQMLDAKGIYEHLWDRVPVDNNREGNEHRKGGFMLALKAIFHNNPGTYSTIKLIATRTDGGSYPLGPREQTQHLVVLFLHGYHSKTNQHAPAFCHSIKRGVLELYRESFACDCKINCKCERDGYS